MQLKAMLYPQKKKKKYILNFIHDSNCFETYTTIDKTYYLQKKRKKDNLNP